MILSFFFDFVLEGEEWIDVEVVVILEFSGKFFVSFRGFRLTVEDWSIFGILSGNVVVIGIRFV